MKRLLHLALFLSVSSATFSIEPFFDQIIQRLLPSHDIPNPIISKPVLTRGINGGFSCGTCTVLLSIAGQLTQVHNETLLASLTRMCSYLPEKDTYAAGCRTLVFWLYPLIEYELLEHTTADSVCYSLRLCYVDPGKKMCNLFPMPKGSSANDISNADLLRPVRSLSDAPLVVKILTEIRSNSDKLSEPWICSIPGVKQLCSALDSVYDKLVPAVDIDGDRFSPTETLRGALWRGRDCNDLRGDIYPGRRSSGDPKYDSNCNGIYGVNATSGRTFEEELCGGSGQRGVIFIGDSVTAHFHAPPKWFTPADLSEGILENITFVVSNEADWPHLGYATGFQNNTMPDLIDGKVQTDSIYLRLRERNLCNHRDYQNLGRNGAESNLTVSSYQRSLSRHKEMDHPAIVVYSLIGNDVCNEFWDTEAHMTPPKVFYDNTVRTLKFLESRLPPGSHVILVGLIDGSILYDAMAQRTHPLGKLNDDLTYDDMYDWFNCMEMGPCHGWMTANETLRKVTTKHAGRLTRMLRKVTRHEKFPSFDIHFVDNPFHTVIREWQQRGGQVWQLIEPVDSLHPTQAAQPLIAEAFWRKLEQDMPEVLGPVNQRNAKIRERFGEQGGH